jgi:type VI secretion system Hcp family effector
MTSIRLVAACVFSCVAVIASPAFAAANTFMSIAGLPGESAQKGHEGDIELTSYSQTIGTKNCSRVVVQKYIDRASPGLVSRAAGNVVIPQVIIKMDKASDSALPQEFFRVTLDQVLIERMELVGSEAGSLTERSVMSPRSITISYRPQDNKGAFGAPIVTTIACP